MANVSISELIRDIQGLKAPIAESITEFEKLQSMMTANSRDVDLLSKKIVELQNGLGNMSAKDVERVNREIVDLQKQVGDKAKETSEIVVKSIDALPAYIKECVKLIESESGKGAEAMQKAFETASKNINESFKKLNIPKDRVDDIYGAAGVGGNVTATLGASTIQMLNGKDVDVMATYGKLQEIEERRIENQRRLNELQSQSFELTKDELAMNEHLDRLGNALNQVFNTSGDNKKNELEEQKKILTEFEDELKRATAEWNAFQSQSFQRQVDPSIMQQRQEELERYKKAIEDQKEAVRSLQEEYNKQQTVSGIMDKISIGDLKAKTEGLKELKGIYMSLSDDMRKSDEVGGAILRIIQILNGETRSMNAELGKSVTVTGEMNTSGMRIRTMLMNLKQEIMQNTQTLNGYDAEIASLTEKMKQMEGDGKINTEEYTNAAKSVDELKRKRSELSDTTADLILKTADYQRLMSGTNAMIKNLSDPNLAMNAMVGTLNQVVQVGTAARSVMTLFGIKNDDVAKGIMKLQALQSVANTTQRITNDLLSKNGTLQKWHALAVKARILYRKQLNIEAKKAIANEAGLTGATAANTAATNVASAANIGLAGTLRAVGAAMKAVPVIGWIMAAVAAVGTLAGLIVSLNSEERKMTIADKDRIKIREKEMETNMAVRKEMENESTRLSYNIMRMKETKEGTEEWRKVVSDVAKQLGVSEEYIIKNKDKVEELAAAWHSMKEQQMLADKYVEAAAEARIQAEEEIMKMNSTVRKERKEGSKEIEGLTNSEQRQYKRLANAREEQEKRIAHLKEQLIHIEQAATKAASENESKMHQRNANNIKQTLLMVENNMSRTQSQIDVLNGKIRDNAQKMSDEYVKQAQEAEEAAKKAKERVDAEAYAAKEIQRQNLAYETRANAEAEVVKSLTLGNMRMDANVEKLGRLNKGSGEYNKTIKAIAGDLGVNDEWLKSNIDKVGDLAEAWKKVKFAEAMSGKYLESAANEAAEFESVKLLALTSISGEALDEMLKNNKFINEETAKSVKEINAQYTSGAITMEKAMSDMNNTLSDAKTKQEQYTTSMKNLANEEMEKVAEESKALAEAQKHNKQTMASAINARKEIENIQVELERLRTEGQPDNYLKKSAALDKWYNEQKMKFRKHNDVLVELEKLYNAKKAKIEEEEKRRYEKVLNDNYKLIRRMKLESEKETIRLDFEIGTDGLNRDLTLTEKEKTEKLVALRQQYMESMKRIEEERGAIEIEALRKEFEEKTRYLNLTSDEEKNSNEEYLSWKELYDEKIKKQEQDTQNALLKIETDGTNAINDMKSKSLIDEFENEQEDDRVQRTIERGGRQLESIEQQYEDMRAVQEQIMFYQQHTYEELGMTAEEYYMKLDTLEAERLTKARAVAEEERKIRMDNIRSVTDSMATLGNAMAGFVEDEVARVKVEQMIALAQVAINQGLAISEAIRAIMEAKDMGNSTAVIAQKAIAIGAAVATITAQMISTIQTINQATANVSAYAEGTEHHKGGDAIVGEGGKPELVIARNRKFLIEKPTLIKDLPVGSQVIPLDGRDGGVDLSNIERGLDMLNGRSMVRIDVGRNVYSYIVGGASKARVLNKQFIH